MSELDAVDLNLLLTFKTFVDEGTVHAAAKSLSRSQPAISARLRQLRDSLGADLVVRSGRRLVLTPAGRLVYARATKIRDEVQHLIDDVRSDADEGGGTLRIGVLPTIGVFVAAPVIARMRRDHPRARFELESALVSELLGRLGGGDVDLVVGVGRVPLAERVETLGEVKPVLVMKKTRVRGSSGRSALRERALAEMPWISYGRVDDDFFASVEHFLASRGITDRVGVRVSHIETIKSLILEGAGVAILPD